MHFGRRLNALPSRVVHMIKGERCREGGRKSCLLSEAGSNSLYQRLAPAGSMCFTEDKPHNDTSGYTWNMEANYWSIKVFLSGNPEICPHSTPQWHNNSFSLIGRSTKQAQDNQPHVQWDTMERERERDPFMDTWELQILNMTRRLILLLCLCVNCVAEARSWLAYFRIRTGKRGRSSSGSV